MSYLFIAAVALLGSFIQSASGFGYAILCMSLWPLVLPFHTASIIEVLTAFAMVACIAIRLRRQINIRLLFWPALASMFSSTFGVFTLMASTESFMRRILGGVLVCLSIYFIFFSQKVRLKPTWFTGIAAGLVSGFCGGLFNIGGPPMVAYFLSVTDDKLEYNATLQCYFCLTTIYIFTVHLAMGNITREVLQLSGMALAGVAAGTILGSRLFRRLSMDKIRKFVYLFMVMAGIALMITG